MFNFLMILSRSGYRSSICFAAPAPAPFFLMAPAPVFFSQPALATAPRSQKPLAPAPRPIQKRLTFTLLIPRFSVEVQKTPVHRIGYINNNFLFFKAVSILSTKRTSPTLLYNLVFSSLRPHLLNVINSRSSIKTQNGSTYIKVSSSPKSYILDLSLKPHN